MRRLYLVSNVTVSTAPGSSPRGLRGARRHRGQDGAAAGPEKPLTPQQLKILQAIVAGNKVAGVFLALSPLPSALCPLHPGTALWRAGQNLPPAPGCSPCSCCASVSLLRNVLWCQAPSSSLHLPNGPELPHSPPACPGCPLPLTSAWGRVACRAAELPGDWKRRAETRCHESTECHQETRDGPSSLLGHQLSSSSSSSAHSSRQSQARLRSSLGETSWHGLSAAAGQPGRSVPGCAGSASSWAQPQPQSTRITLDLCRFPHQNRERGGGFNFLFPCQSSSAFRPSGKSLSAMERRLEWLVLSSSGAGMGWQ